MKPSSCRKCPLCIREPAFTKKRYPEYRIVCKSSKLSVERVSAAECKKNRAKYAHLFIRGDSD